MNMAVPYDFFRTPQPKNKDKVRYHARVVVRDTMETEDIARMIASRSTIKEGDVTGTLVELAKVLLTELPQGRSIHINGIGSFRVSAHSPSVRTTKEIRAESIQFKGIVFTPEKKLMRKMGAVSFEKVTYSNRSNNISDIEIDARLTDFFADHDYITTAQMRGLCGLSYMTALRRLQTRVKDGRLTHPGHSRAPFYYPVPGNFRKSRL
jgi:putative DNA-binding protein